MFFYGFFYFCHCFLMIYFVFLGVFKKSSLFKGNPHTLDIFGQLEGGKGGKM